MERSSGRIRHVGRRRDGLAVAVSIYRSRQAIARPRPKRRSPLAAADLEASSQVFNRRRRPRQPMAFSTSVGGARGGYVLAAALQNEEYRRTFDAQPGMPGTRQRALNYRPIDRSNPVPETRPTMVVRANTHTITDLRSTSIGKVEPIAFSGPLGFAAGGRPPVAYPLQP